MSSNSIGNSYGSFLSQVVFGSPTPLRAPQRVRSPRDPLPPSPLRSCSTTPVGESSRDHASNLPHGDSSSERSSSSSPSSDGSPSRVSTPTLSPRRANKALQILGAHVTFFKSNEEKFLSQAKFLNLKVFPLTPLENVNKQVNERAYALFRDLHTACKSSMTLVKASQGYLSLEFCITSLREKIESCRAIAASTDCPLTKDEARTEEELVKWHEADIARRIVSVGNKLLKRLS